MIYVFYGEEVFDIASQKQRFKDSFEEMSYQEFTSVEEMMSYLYGESLFVDVLSCYLKVDSITALTTKNFLDFVDIMRDRKERQAFIYLSKVKTDAKGLTKLKDHSVTVVNCPKIANETALISRVKDMCKKQDACFTEDAIKELVARSDYLNKYNEDVNLFVLDNAISQLKYLSDEITKVDVENNFDDLRLGQRFKLASFIDKGDVSGVKREMERLEKEKDFKAIGLLSLLYREYRIAYLVKTGFSLKDIRVNWVNIERMDLDRLIKGLNIISEILADIKTGVFDDKTAFELCLSKLLIVA